MSARRLDGAALAATIRAELAPRISAFRARAGRPPALDIVLVGDNPASHLYVRSKEHIGAQTGLRVTVHRLSSDTNLDDLLAEGVERGTGMLEMVAAFQPLWGTGPWRQVVLWQRVTRPDFLLAMFRTEVPAQFKAPGTWMHDALELRDQWESRLLRTLPWSPLT